MRFSFIIILTLFFFSCKKENMCDCIKSTGTRTTEYHSVSNFNGIIVYDRMDVYLTQGNNYEVRVEAGKNLQSLIKTELDGETLKVFNKNRCNWVRDYNEKINVFITAPLFNYIENKGVGDIQSLSVITQSIIGVQVKNTGDVTLQVNTKGVGGGAHGNGNLYLSGTTDQLFYNYVGTNSLNASDLKVNNYIYLYCNTIGKTYINAPENGLMDIFINQSGNIYYTGNPNTIHLTKIVRAI